MAFQTTRWSLVSRAGRKDTEGIRALDELCSTYWPAVYAMLRREGYPPEDAEDLTQGVFAKLVEREDLGSVAPEKGRFRAFLRACTRHHASQERDRSRAAKRGGDQTIVSIDRADRDAEERWLAREPADTNDPAAAFDRRWAEAVFARSLQAVTDAEVAAGRGSVLEALLPTLDAEGPQRTWAEIAADLGSTEGAVRVAAHRLRQRLRDQLVNEVRHTLDDRDAADMELAELLAALRK